MVLERADNYLFARGLHPVFGILEDGNEVDTSPEDFVDNTLCRCDVIPGGVLPDELYDLLPYTIAEGEELCGEEFKRHLKEYVGVVKARSAYVKKKTLNEAKKILAKYAGKPKCVC